LELPKVNYSILLGFIEILDDVGGKSEIAEIASKEDLELDSLLPILKSGEMLGLINVLGGKVSITEKGHLFIAATPKVRKKMLRDIIVNFDIFKKIVDLIRRSQEGYVTKKELLEFISSHYTSFTTDTTDENPSDFIWLIEWGRQALILKYDANDERVSLRGNVAYYS
jgi:NitT/TauT family transport system ATP-binding protein